MQLEQLTGDKVVSMKVPSEIMNKEVAWIRLRAAQDKIGTSTTYDSATTDSSGKAKCAFVVNYAALRYNK